MNFFDQIVKSAVTFLADFVREVKGLLGLNIAPNSEVAVMVASKGVSIFIITAAFLCLVIPSPTLNRYADTLFRVALRLWGGVAFL